MPKYFDEELYILWMFKWIRENKKKRWKFFSFGLTVSIFLICWFLFDFK